MIEIVRIIRRRNPMDLTATEKGLLLEGIGLILSQWTAMRAAVDNGWGGRDSREKAERTVSTVFDFLIQSKVYPPDYDRLGDILDGGLIELNTVAEDGSVEEVTETLLDLYDECLKGNSHFLDQLRLANAHNTASSVVKVSNDDEDSDDEDDQTTDMMVDAPNHSSNQNPEAMPPVDDGWTVVPSRKNKGKRN